MSTVIEVVLFASKPDATPARVRAAAGALAPVLAQLDGFISRELAYDGSRWVDIVHWRDMDSALAASRAVATLPACQPFFSLIDPQSITMLHCTTELSQHHE